MENNSKRNISIFMIVGGLIVLSNYFFKMERKEVTTPYIVVIIASLVFVLIGVFSLLKAIKKND